jgi:hypothetical protein
MAEYWLMRFPDGVYTGDSATSLLRRLSKAQWDDESRSRIKRALAWRAWVLTHEMLNEHDDDETFIRAFCALGLAELEVTTHGTSE